MINTKEINIVNETMIQNRPLTVSVNITDGRMDLARISFNGRGEIFSLPVEEIGLLIDVLRESLDEARKVVGLVLRD